MLRSLAVALISALNESEFIDRVADLLLDKLRSKAGVFESARLSVLNRVTQKFEGMGMTGIFLKRMLQDNLDELVAEAERQTNGKLTLKDLPLILDGVSETEITEAQEIVAKAIQRAIDNALAKATM